MTTLRLILADQLSLTLPSLRDASSQDDVILMAEVMSEATYVRHHKQKIAFLFSAMRHFAERLRADGFTVHYRKIDDDDNRGSLLAEVEAAVSKIKPSSLIMTACGEYPLHEEMQSWDQVLDIPIMIREDDRFLCSIDGFNQWAEGRKTLTMEFFYREMRKKTGLLMEEGSPVGGQWNFDADNRKKLPKGYDVPARSQPALDAITREVLGTVDKTFPDHFGTLDRFNYAVTRDGALSALDEFIEHHLPRFGDYQDAMATGEDFLHHSLLSAYLNAGLLDPLEMCRAAEEAYKDGHAPINAAEGFIRQIIGWREFIRGIYWRFMPEYKERNALEAGRPLPDFYWTGETDMHCMAEAIRTTRDHAYAHHIQRLMVTGNFALLAGIDPGAINDWYLVVYADAFEWVQLPNTHGMAIWADGGVVGTKPYAASGAYINRMSNYCGSCRYSVTKKTGPDACPFNYLYWDFFLRHEDRFKGNNRLNMVMRNLAKKTPAERRDIRDSATAFFDRL